MSHISSYKTEIQLDSALSQGLPVEEDPGWDILNDAIYATAEEMNLDVTRSFRDYYGRAIACDWALVGPDIPRGIGITVDRKTGEVVFSCDPYGGFERIAGEIKDRVVQNYASLCVAKALSALNYNVEVDEVKHPVEGKKVLIKGVL
ncbi:MAG TPA: hypothetical protein GX500_01955 [Firmicutes bacterium]|nr:hypothetical protein [Candidatus Fermentithermobacillaceae bacterium]